MKNILAKWGVESFVGLLQIATLLVIIGLAVEQAITTGVRSFTTITQFLFLLLILGVVETRRRRRKFAQQLHEINSLSTRLATSIRTLIDLDSQTRRDIAEWMHGEIQQSILRISRVMKQHDFDKANKELHLLDEKIARGGATKLLPMQLQISLGVALADLCAGRAELTIPDDFSFGRVEKLSGLILPFDARLAIYRVVQEGINNAEKKGTATRIAVSLETEGTSVHVTVFDNGHPLPEIFAPSFGLSLVDAYTSAHHGTWSLSNNADGVTLKAVFSDVLHPITDVIPTTLNDLKKST